MRHAALTDNNNCNAMQQTQSSSVVVILTACDPTYTAVHRRRSCVSGGWNWKPPLEQSAT